MKVRLKTIMCGPDGNAQPGDIVEFPNDQAAHLLSTNQAEPIGDTSETATHKPHGETAVKHRKPKAD